MKKVPDPDPAGQKSPDPTGSGSSSLIYTQSFFSLDHSNVEVNPNRILLIIHQLMCIVHDLSMISDIYYIIQLFDGYKVQKLSSAFIESSVADLDPDPFHYRLLPPYKNQPKGIEK